MQIDSGEPAMLRVPAPLKHADYTAGAWLLLRRYGLLN